MKSNKKNSISSEKWEREREEKKMFGIKIHKIPSKKDNEQQL